MTAVCCNQCFHTIASNDAPAAKLWLDLCAYFVKWEGNFKLRENRVPGVIKHFRNLEKMGFISTADGPDSVVVRVNGYDIILVEEQEMCLDTFCLDREKHQSEWL
jgi:hypothetical protein